MKLRKPIKVIYISTYIPQKCGIATFTKDVTTAINLLNPHALAKIITLVKEDEKVEFPPEVSHKIVQSDLDSYLSTAAYINNSDYDLVVIEHEFGIFGGDNGNYLIPLLEAIRKPKIMTCHTIIDDPHNEYGQIFQKLIANVDGLTVMTKSSAQKIIKFYGVSKKCIAVIPHGTPDLSYSPTQNYKKRKKLLGRTTIGNINLLSRNKGIDYSLEAIAQVVKKFPSILYFVIGQTHPNILKNEGELYRNSLKLKIKKLGIQKNVRFINRYLSSEELINWLRTLDFYITPYLESQQSSSGALAYAVGAGKLCISTKYLYAREILSNGRGIFVPFRDADAIAKSILAMLKNPLKKEIIQKRAYQYGRFMTWPNVANLYLDFFTEIIKKHGK